MSLAAVLASLICLTAHLALAQSTGPGKDRQLIQPETSVLGRKIEKRLALVIGNSAYRNASKLTNPINDAHDMAEALRALGFEVMPGEDLSAEKMRELIGKFGERLRLDGGVGLFYYAGHGVQVDGKNYLIPVEANALRENSIEDEAVDVGRVLRKMEDAHNGLNIVILDACRSNPFTRSWRSADNGLVQLNSPTGTLIAYATAPGAVANDGSGRNGLYTAELLRQMRKPGLSIEQMFKEVRRSVLAQTGGKQVPWESSMLIGDFYFGGNSATTTKTADTADVEREFWDSIKNSNDTEDFRTYLKEYPNGAHTSLARNDLRRLEVKVRADKQFIGKENRSPMAQTSSEELQNQARANLLVGSGDASRMKGEYDSAIKDLTEAIRLNPNATMAYALRGDAYHSKGKDDLAILDFTQAIRIDPKFAWAYSLRAVVYIGKNENELGLSDLNQVIQLEPKNYWAYERRAGVYRVTGRTDLAAIDEQRQMTDLTEAIRLSPNNSQAYAARCDAYRMKYKLDLALDDCNEAIRLDPKNGWAYGVRGDVYRLKGDKDFAIRDLSESIRLFPTYWVYDRRAEAYRAAGLTRLAEMDEQKSKELKGTP